MAFLVDLGGLRFGHLTVIGRVPGNYREATWRCACDCGREAVARGWNLRSGAARSCGCMRIFNLKPGSSKTHGAWGTPEYRAWIKMRVRCYYPAYRHFSRYGGRGISVCARWRNDPVAFLADVGPRPSPAHSLDRIDNDGNYEPGNVRWATKTEQNENTSQNVFVELNGERATVTAWCRRTGVKVATARSRIINGWEPARAVSEPARRAP